MMQKGKQGECSAPVRAAAWRNTKNTLQKFNYTCVLVSFSGALDKNKQTTRIQNYLSHFFLNSFVFFFSSSSFCRMLGPLMVGVQSLFV